MAKKRDTRPTMTFKGEAFTPEFRALINKAARRRKLTQAAFVAEALEAAARRTLEGGTPSDNPEASPPAIIPPEILERQAAVESRIEEMARQLQEMAKRQDLSLWKRIRGAKF